MSVVASNAINQVIAGRYRLVELVGSGGMGSVYLARDEVVSRDVAVKVFREEAATAADRVRQEREIKLLSVLAHPGLISLFDAGEHLFRSEDRLEGHTRRFLVMELVAAPSLQERLHSGPLPLGEVAGIGAQVAEALSYVHSKGIVHRDVKPANILVSDVGSSGFSYTAKLTDFGVASFIDGGRVTIDGAVIGTASYVAPEQVAGEPVSGASDVYSLGLVLLEAVTGRREFTGTVVEAAVARLSRDPHIPDDLPPEWRLLLASMTARHPEHRPSAGDVAAVLRGRDSITTGEGELHTVRPPHGRRAKRRGRIPRAVYIAVGTTGVVALCAASWVLGANLPL